MEVTASRQKTDPNAQTVHKLLRFIRPDTKLCIKILKKTHKKPLPLTSNRNCNFVRQFLNGKSKTKIVASLT